MPKPKKQAGSFLKNGLMIVVAGLILVGIIFLAVSLLRQPEGCTMEAKICPDGSSVGRVGPDCDFAPCPGMQMANPASVYCERFSGTLDLASGDCSLPDGAVCNEWALYRGECSPYPAAETISSIKFPQSDSCSVDSDCAPASGCHPTSCINKQYVRPNNLMCTMVCLGPLDCGAGSCKCVDSKCSVVPA
jgi:putative hemolysin